MADEAGTGDHRVRPGPAGPDGRAVLTDPLTLAAAGVTALAVAWFAAGPDNGQLLGYRMMTPALSIMIAIGQWRVCRDCRLPATSVRFWRILSLGMFTYSTGMLVDLASLVWNELTGAALPEVGQTFFYPPAGVFSIIALITFPTVVHGATARVKVGLDMAIVLFGSATFVWYFLASLRWAPSGGWPPLSSALVLPAVTLVAGFAILRIAMAGANVITRPTAACFVFAAVYAVISNFMDPSPESQTGRLRAMLQAVALTACVLGVVIQRRSPPPQLATLRIWRRSFTVLPYGALVATVGLLVVVIADDLDYRGIGVAGGMLAMCAVVMARQLASLWENSRLLSANRDLTSRLRYQAFHDHLTGLVNRTLFTERVTEALARAASRQVTVTVLFVDLDDFKIVNDSLGHQAGDDLLVAVANRLRDTVPAEETLGRLGGDEFAILLAESRHQDLPALAERVITALSSPFLLLDMQVRIEASVGIAIASGAGTSSAELLRNADVAMYSAKSTKKGSWQIFEPGMLAGLLYRHQQRAALIQAVDRGEFIVHYQPIVDLADGTVQGAEALVRWRQRGDRIVLPGEFIPLAEETGLIAEIERQVLRQACQQAARWQARPPGQDGACQRFALHVNLAARQLDRADLVVDVERALCDSGLPAQCLTLEITEDGLGQDHETAIERLGALRRLGVHLAIDDFGTGYSSLAYLRQMPVDVLKIDKTFTDELLDEGVTAPLAEVVISLAEALGMQTVAEGIEKPEQADRLLSFGCRFGQGFYYARPLAAKQMDELVAGTRRLSARAVGADLRR